MPGYRIPAAMSRCGILLACVLSATPAAASTFNISPIRAELSGAHRTEVLILTNVEDQPVVVQVRVVSWSQQNGEEQLADTRDILATPPVLQIPASSEQIVRVALRREPDPGQELAYRVVFEEVPQAAPKDFTGLRVALRLSVPVFVAAAKVKAAPQLSWESRWLPGGQLEVAAVNHGSGHLQITDFEVRAADASSALRGVTSKYVLPGSRMTWTLTPPTLSPLMGSPSSGSPSNGTGVVESRASLQGFHTPLTIHGHSDQGEFSADAAISGL